MGRRFTSTTDRIYVGAAGLNGFDFRYGTVAAVVNVVSLTLAGTVFATNEAAASCIDLYISDNGIGSANLKYWDGTNDATTVTGLSAGVTYVVGVTKASGTATARGHAYNTATGAWTHTAGSTTNVNSSANTSIGIGNYADSSSDPLDAEIFAIAAWPSLAMTDSEFERLARGNWLNYAPGFYEQFTDGAEVGDMVRTLGRYSVRQTARSGTTRGAQRNPPGFRMAPQSRRR